jgi:hypothetical protein
VQQVIQGSMCGSGNDLILSKVAYEQIFLAACQD